MKIAQFKSLEHGFETVAGEELGGCSDSYVRMTEWAEVEFTPLSGDEHIQGAVAALDRQRERVTDEFSQKLADIDRRKSELLAITHQPIEGG